MIKFRREVRRRQRSAVRFFGDVGVILSRVRSRNPTLPVGSLVMIRKFYLRIRCLTLSTDSSSSFAKLMPAPTSGRALLLTFLPVDSRFAPLIICYSIPVTDLIPVCKLSLCNAVRLQAVGVRDCHTAFQHEVRRPSRRRQTSYAASPDHHHRVPC